MLNLAIIYKTSKGPIWHYCD